jgi:two-component system LytT family response regulator
MRMEKPISCLIIDEDEHSSRLLAGELRKRAREFELLGVHTCYKDGLQRMAKFTPDVVFVDINVPFFSGRELLGVVSGRSFKVIFLARESHYVHQPLKTGRFDCLLKPFNAVDLRRALNGLVEGQRRPFPLVPGQVTRSDEFVFDKLALPTANGHVFVDPNEILYCQADEEYTRITTIASTHLISKHLKYFEARLSSRRFLRIHKSYLLNLEHIRSTVKSEGGYVIMTNDKLIPIGRSKKKEFLLLMGL